MTWAYYQWNWTQINNMPYANNYKLCVSIHTHTYAYYGDSQNQIRKLTFRQLESTQDDIQEEVRWSSDNLGFQLSHPSQYLQS